MRKIFFVAFFVILGSICTLNADSSAESKAKSSIESKADFSPKSSADFGTEPKAESNPKSSADFGTQNTPKSSKIFSPKSNFALGIFGNFGTMMGGGLEAGFCLYCGEIWQVRNAISLEAKGIKLHSNSYDTLALIAHEKIMLSATLGSSLASRIGLAFFRPYLHISGGFGLLDFGGFARSPYYYEAQGGLGHDFITLKGHSVFFEIGGGVADLSAQVPNKHAKSGLGGIFKMLFGARFYF